MHSRVLQVEDLDDISNLQGYIARTQKVLIYCSQGYFQSKNCMIELRSTVVKKKSIITLMEPEKSKGGLTQAEIQSQLIDADASYATWGFDEGKPRGEELFTELFATKYIEWNRIGCFQDVTMRLIAVRLLPEKAGAVYVQGEIVHKKPALKKPATGKRFHVYCSQLNGGAVAVMEEMGGT